MSLAPRYEPDCPRQIVMVYDKHIVRLADKEKLAACSDFLVHVTPRVTNLLVSPSDSPTYSTAFSSSMPSSYRFHPPAPSPRILHSPPTLFPLIPLARLLWIQ